MAKIEHEVTHWGGDDWSCECGEEFASEEEALAHRQNAESPGSKLMNCIARQTHHSQPIEIIYEMRGVKIPSGAVVSSPVDNRTWMQTNQASAERSRVTVFGCPSCGHQDELKW
jgi:hypothetical protein